MKTPYILISLISALLFISCTEKVENIETDGIRPDYTIYGMISDEAKAHEISISRTDNFYSAHSTEGISGANVKLYDGTNTIILTEDPKKKGSYLTAPDFKGEIGKTYTLTITNIDGKPDIYTASSKLIRPFKLDSIQLGERKHMGHKTIDIKVYAMDQPEKNFYAFKVIKNNVLISDTIDNIVVTDDKLFDNVYSSGVICQILDQDIPDEIVNDGDIIGFEVNGITEDYYKYVTQIKELVQGNNPIFSGPSANPITNISGKSVAGFFTAYSVDRKFRKLVLKDLNSKK